MKILKYLKGNVLNPYIQEWSNQWKERMQPSASSKVLLKWNASGRKPKPETSQERTNRRIKEETKRTWRSDAADIAHGIGEAVLSFHPYTAIPYFGAKVGQDILNGNVGWQTAVNASIPLFHLSPQAVGLKEATNVALEDAANVGSKTARNWRVAREINLATKSKPNIEVPNPIQYNISDNITLYRANPTKIKNFSYKGERYGDNSGLYIGKWFTDDPSKPHWYASNAAKRGEEPAYYQFSVPKYWANQQRAYRKISNPNIEFEPEDFIIEDGIKGLTGLLYKGKPGTTQYLLLNFQNLLSEPKTSLKFFERKPSRISLAEREGVPKGDRNIKQHGQPASQYVDYSLINRNYEPWTVNEKGQFVFDSPEKAKKLSTIHFSLNEPVLSHIQGSWDDAPTITLLPYRNMRSLTAPADIAIMDTFFPNYNGLKVSSRGSKTLTGDRNTYEYYKSKGINVEFNPTLESLRRKIRILDKRLERMSDSEKFSEGNYSKQAKEMYNLRSELSDRMDNIVREWSSQHTKPIPNFKKLNEFGKAEGFDMDKYPYSFGSPDRYGSSDISRRLGLDYTWHSDPSNHFGAILNPLYALEIATKNNYRPEYIKWLKWLTEHKADYRKQGGKMNNVIQRFKEYYKKGGSIYIKPSKRGSFTRWCGGKVTNECILKGKNSSNPAIRKKATFALNARHWKHKDGSKITINSKV